MVRWLYVAERFGGGGVRETKRKREREGERERERKRESERTVEVRLPCFVRGYAEQVVRARVICRLSSQSHPNSSLANPDLPSCRLQRKRRPDSHNKVKHVVLVAQVPSTGRQSPVNISDVRGHQRVCEASTSTRTSVDSLALFQVSAARHLAASAAFIAVSEH